MVKSKKTADPSMSEFVVDELLPVEEMTKHGVDVNDVKKIKAAGIINSNFLITLSNKDFTDITVLSGEKADSILTAAKGIVGTYFAESTHAVLVEGLAKDVTQNYLEKRFEVHDRKFKSGRGFESAHIPGQRDPKRKKYGLVFFKTKDHAEHALELNGSLMKRQKISVRMLEREEESECSSAGRSGFSGPGRSRSKKVAHAKKGSEGSGKSVSQKKGVRFDPY